MASEDFGKDSGPRSQAPFGIPSSFPSMLNPNPFDKKSPTTAIPLPTRQQQMPHQPNRPAVSPHSWDNQPKQPATSYPTIHQRLSPVADYVTVHDAETKFPTKPINFHVPIRTRSPPLPSRDDAFLDNYHFADANTGRPAVSPHSWDNQLNQPANLDYRTIHQRLSPVANYATPTIHQKLSPVATYATPTIHQRLSPVATHVTGHDPETKFLNKPINFHVPTRTRSPPSPSHEVNFLDNYHSADDITGRPGTHTDMRFKIGTAERSKWTKPPPPSAFEINPFDQNRNSSHEEAQRPDVSPPTSHRKSSVNFANSPPHQGLHPLKSYSDTHDAGTLSPPKPSYINSAKRARSPPLHSANVSSGTSSVQLDSEREMIAKAKRLARFNVELSQPMENLHDVTRHKASGFKHYQAALDKRNADDPAEDAQCLDNGGLLSDNEGLESSSVVVGLCPDMCPESERQERERKGDLDKYERLDGDRNQTSKFIAVKKYTRTAEREAELIRPMPVLQKTVDYLLHLLDQPYNDNFLNIYNFLWDRMRAIRMDLRMQHIFNREAIIMLEQMIRLHIIAMHELCEYKKGEGFSEGFDAHLNIEQMNKTSVELFQLYDDHRKRGNSVPTEKEFRGYYALLKLDKHPGYKVEPAELSLDLAKMTSEIRCTPEILFARAVARACRIGNYIAFFRLARKATYVEACLMHAHFAKLRTQALASLHSGLQNNQGIPVPHVVKWLGMEGEDIESLLEYHGFAVKKYEEIYMMKEGPFLNLDSDFPTKCSQLVHLKKSRRIVDDVYSSQTLSRITEEKEIGPVMVDPRSRTSRVNTVDEKIVDSIVKSVPRATIPAQQLLEEPAPTILNVENEDVITERSPSASSCASLDDSRSSHLRQVEDGQVFESDGDIFINERNLPKFEGSMVQAEVPGGSNSESMIMNFEPEVVIGKAPDDEALTLIPQKQDEAANEKLKFILRKWKQQASIRKEIREQREFLANAALSLLSLGPPIRKINAHPRFATADLNIDYAARERYGRREKSWSSLNVSELVAPVLSARNPEARCICWKAVMFIQPNNTENQTDQLASRWLLSKLRGSRSDDGLVVSLSKLSIWKKWIETSIGDPQACCLSVIREAMFDDNQPIVEDEVIAGTGSIMFVVSETVPWETQRVRLHKLLISIPSGSELPLLVVSIGPSREEIINRLGLHDADHTRINTFTVVSLAGDLNGFFDDDQLREGLKWLANHSPLQPSLRMVRTRELVSSFLRHSTDVLNNLNSSDVGPNRCISAFNEALDRVSSEIIAAASVNPNRWPCPEIDLVEKSSNERILADMSLPKIGWSSAAWIEPLVRAIKGCKLPSFPTSNIFQGAHDVGQIQNQKLAIGECLVRYLTQSSGLLNPDLATREASVMLQNGASLELRGSCYHIVPRWSVIFRRIYNWRLMKLADGEFSVAYVLDRRTDGVVPMDSLSWTDEEKFGSERHHQPWTELTLDEMVEISCSLPLALPPPPLLPPQQPPSVNMPLSPTLGENNSSGDVDGRTTERNKERPPVAVLTGEKDRFAMLLRECNRVQDMIDQKLYIYF